MADRTGGDGICDREATPPSYPTSALRKLVSAMSQREDSPSLCPQKEWQRNVLDVTNPDCASHDTVAAPGTQLSW